VGFVLCNDLSFSPTAGFGTPPCTGRVNLLTMLAALAKCIAWKLSFRDRRQRDLSGFSGCCYEKSHQAETVFGAIEPH
jgi:hypothetical protein